MAGSLVVAPALLFLRARLNDDRHTSPSCLALHQCDSDVIGAYGQKMPVVSGFPQPLVLYRTCSRARTDRRDVNIV